MAFVAVWKASIYSQRKRLKRKLYVLFLHRQKHNKQKITQQHPAQAYCNYAGCSIYYYKKLKNLRNLCSGFHTVNEDNLNVVFTAGCGKNHTTAFNTAKLCRLEV